MQFGALPDIAASAPLVGSRPVDTGCGNVVGGDVRNSITNICGIPPEQLEQIVRLRIQPLEEFTETQRACIAHLKADRNLNQGQVRAALDILGETNVAPEAWR